MSTAGLDEGYLRLAGSGPEWGADRLTNHGPMVVEVLARRGRDAQIHAWLDQYLPRLDELPGPVERITDQNWPEALGVAGRVGDWTRYLMDQLADRSWQSLLVTWWPRLLPGILGGATHGVIRVGHAVRALTDGPASPVAAGELACGLAFWAAHVQYVPGSEPARTRIRAADPGEADPAGALDALPRIPVQRGTVLARVSQLDRLAGWAAGLAALRPPADPSDTADRLGLLVQAAAHRYLWDGYASPVLLVHTATAPNAVLHTLPVLPVELWVPSLTAVWTATAALTACYAPAPAGRPAETTEALDPPADPQEAMDRAVHHRDEHVIKFTDTAVEAYERSGDRALLAATARAAELIASPR